MNIPPNTDPNGQTPPGSVPPGQTPTVPQGLTPNGQPQQKTSMDNLPLDIQDYIKELRKDAETNRKALEAKVQAERQADEQKLKEQGEWQKVAEQSTARVKEIESVVGKYDALSGLLSDQIKAQTKDWPKEVKDLLPGDEASIEVRYSQVQKLQNLANQLADQTQSQQRASLPGNAPGPRQATKDQSREAQKEHFRQERVRRGMYSI